MTGLPIPRDPDARIWRYLSLAKFAWLLEKKRLWLSRVDRLGDPFEMALPAGTVRELARRSDSSPDHGELPQDQGDRERLFRERLRERIFVSCWTLLEHESLAMWRLYCGDTEGVAIQTRVKRLVHSLPGLIVARVTYLDYERDSFPDLAPEFAYIAPVLYKCHAYSHEKEVRAVFHYEWEDDRGQYVDGLEVDWDPATNIESIYAHPNSPLYFVQALEGIASRLTPEISKKVWYSKLARTPQY